MAAVSVALFITAAAVFNYSNQSSVTVDLDSWSWLTSVRVAAVQSAAPAVTEEQQSPKSPVVLVADQETSKNSAKKPEFKRTAKRRVPRSLRPVAQARDRVVLSAAAPVIEKKEATTAQLIRMQALYGVLRNQFHASLRAPVRSVGVASGSMVSPRAAVSVVKKSEAKRKPRVVRQVAKTIQKPEIGKRLNIQAKETLNTQPVVVAKVAKTLVKAMPIQARQVPMKMSAVAPEIQLEPKAGHGRDQVAGSQVTAGQVREKAPPVPVPTKRIVAVQERARPEPSAITNDYSINDSRLDSHKGAASVEDIKRDRIVNTHAQAFRLPVVSPQPPSRVPPVPVPLAPKPEPKPESRTVQENRDYSVTSLETERCRSAKYVEGFADGLSLGEVKVNAITVEAEGCGWQIASAGEHWPTLHRKNGGVVPLVSHNSAKMLSRLADRSELQNEAGIVFGLVPKGWRVSLSARAERPVMLNAVSDAAGGAPASAQKSAQMFVMINAAPGSHVLQISDTQGQEIGSVVLLVIGGTATYVDLTQFKKVDLTGRVLDAAFAGAKGIPHAKVQIIGQPKKTAESDKDGFFRIPDVFTVPEHPLYLDSDAASSYTHRYMILPTEASDVALFRFSERQMQGWRSQLEGGISNESGMIVAASVGPQRSGKGGIYPTLKPLLSNSSLTPELYSLSLDNELQVKKPLEEKAPRFLGVQISSGPFIVGVQDSSRKRIWSQLSVVDKDVISVVLGR